MILNADARYIPLREKTVQCCVTSPPYFGLRDYRDAAQIGREPTWSDYTTSLVYVFREVSRVLKDDGVVWVNLGDSYGPKKNLCGIPWRFALAMQQDGWILRSDIIWHKTSGLPESVTDRPTRNHEYLFMFVKSERYYYNASAIMEPIAESTRKRYQRIVDEGEAYIPGHHKASVGVQTPMELMTRAAGKVLAKGVRNKRTVWSLSPQNYRGAHTAVFPETLPAPCILSSSRPGDVVLDPFSGSGTTGVVAEHYGRRYVGLELNPAYIAESVARIRQGSRRLPKQIEPSLFDTVL
jgi:DNA modification methylase